jgi:hypothetical protein
MDSSSADLPLSADPETLSADPETGFSLQAIVVSTEALDLSPAPIRRAWMEGTPERFANRCLPLLVANQSGWIVTTRNDIRATWDGSPGLHSVHVETDGVDGPPPGSSHFGSGIITFSLPWLFRTSPGWNLLVRGPANWPIDGAHPLEGLVETDWNDATFTMNWMLTRPGHEVLFPAGSPICMIVPQLRGELERFDTSIASIHSDRRQHDSYLAWREGRLEFNQQLQVPGSAARKEKWQRDYFLGSTPEAQAAGHQRRRDLKPFVESATAGRPPESTESTTQPSTTQSSTTQPVTTDPKAPEPVNDPLMAKPPLAMPVLTRPAPARQPTRPPARQASTEPAVTRPRCGDF